MRLFSVSTCILFLYALTGSVPYFEAADKIHTQMLYLSILNILSIYYVFSYFTKEPTLLLFNYIKKLPVFTFFLFFLWSVLTIIPAINIGESLIQTTYYFQQFISFVIILVFLDYQKKNLHSIIKIIVILVTSIEISATLYPYIEDILTTGQPLYRSLEYRGITGSLNILAFSLLIKLPFLFYFTIKENRLKFLYVALISLVFFVIFSITKTRAAALYIFLAYPLIFTLIVIFNYRIQKTKIIQLITKPFLIIIFPIILGYSISSYLESQYSDSGPNIEDRISGLVEGDYSSNSRLRYYKHAIASIIEKPLLGVGTGNWELEGTKRDWNEIRGYTVPYHVHNDYLEITAETGIIGGVLYFFMIFYILFLLLKKTISKIRLNQNYLFDFILLISLSAYLFDALLNFPSARPLQQINLFFILSISIIQLNDSIREFKIKNIRAITFFLVFLLPFSIYSSLRIYSSSLDQKEILGMYNTGITEVDLDWLDSVDDTYPSLTTTSVPIRSFKGYFYYKNKLAEESLKLFDEGVKYNPYIYFSEGWKSGALFELGRFDSAQYYAKIAYNKIPNNLLHYGHLSQTYIVLKDSISLKELYENQPNKETLHNELYLVGMSEIIDKDSDGFALDNFNLLEKSASRWEKQGFYQLSLGYENMIDAARFHKLGEYSFEKKEYASALDYFTKAASLNPIEIPYQENLANAYLQLNRNQEAITTINKIEENSVEISNKARYTRSLALISINNLELACKDMQILLGSSYIPEYLYIQFCVGLETPKN